MTVLCSWLGPPPWGFVGRTLLSHETGKIEILAVDAEHIYLRYHQAKKSEDLGRFLICHRDDEAYWLDDLEPVECMA